VPFLSNTSIKFKVFKKEEEINNLFYQEKIKKLKDLLKKFFHKVVKEDLELILIV
jgi:hypothetical protein